MPQNSSYPGVSYFLKILFFSVFLSPAAAQPNYYFPLNRITFGYYNNNITDAHINQYFTPPYLPIFWDAPLRVRKGFIGMYERNFYHTQKYFSLDWGISAASWTSRVLSNQFYTMSAFLDLNIWFLRSKYVDLYFTYSIAGPSYLSLSTIDYHNMGGNFIFQDALGIGALIGTQKHINFSVKIGHYSNGRLLPSNPGIDVPFIFSLGLAFG